MNPLLNYILVNFHVDAGRMGSLDGHFITTPAKLELIKGLPSVWFHDVLGKHSEIEVDFGGDDVMTVVSDDQDFIYKAAKIFKADQKTGHLMGFNPFWQLIDFGEGLVWEDGDNEIPAPWFPLNAAEPE